ncbi:MAG: 30S ribosomal protein S20 [Candidatus Hydrogenedentota bacterium]
MANIKSQKKRILTNELARQRNVQVRSRLKTFLKNADAAVASKDSDAIQATMASAIREVDLAVKKGVIHQNSGARKKSHLEHSAAQTLKG